MFFITPVAADDDVYWLNITSDGILVQNNHEVSQGDKLTIQIKNDYNETVGGDILFNGDNVGNTDNNSEKDNKFEKLKKYAMRLFKGASDNEIKSLDVIIDYDSKRNKTIAIKGKVGDIETNNTINIIVLTDYSLIKSNKILTLRNDNEYRNDLEENIRDYEYHNATLNTEIKSLDVNTSDFRVLVNSTYELDKSYSEILELLNEDKVRDETKYGEIAYIINDLNDTNEYLILNLIDYSEKVKVDDLKIAQNGKDELESDIADIKSNIRARILSWGIIGILIGFISGYINVQFWKNKAFRIGLYSNKPIIENSVKYSRFALIIFGLMLISIFIFKDGFSIFKYII